MSSFHSNPLRIHYTLIMIIFIQYSLIFLYIFQNTKFSCYSSFITCLLNIIEKTE